MKIISNSNTRRDTNFIIRVSIQIAAKKQFLAIILTIYLDYFEIYCYYNDMKCDIEIFHNNKWHMAATFSVFETQVDKGYRGAGKLVYDLHYALENLNKNDYCALSCRNPVNFDYFDSSSWPPFLLDLLPSGAGRRSILNQLNLSERGPKSDWPLLLQGASNPVGNLRIMQANQGEKSASHSGFIQSEIVERAEKFIEYAHSHGAPVAGSSGVQGDAPKFLLTQDQHGRWHADGALEDDLAKKHWIVKFPRGRLQSDYAVLRNEFAYYKVAKDLGLRVHALPEFINNTLFIPRFDREVKNGKVIRYGQESLTSLVGISDFGNAIPMQDLAMTIMQYTTHPKVELLEFLYRDITNIALGNTDNHGRNTAIRKFTDGTIQLTPIYDLAPMILDDQGIARICRWGKHDHGGNPDWENIIKELGALYQKQGITEQWLAQQLYGFSYKIENLPKILKDANVDDDLINLLDQRIKGIIQTLKSLNKRKISND